MVFMSSGGTGISQSQGYHFQFFGYDYSERDWDTEKPRHYIYDHGIELEDVFNYSAGSGAYATKHPCSLSGYKPAVANAYYEFDTQPIDLTSYSKIRIYFGLHFYAIDGQNVSLPKTTMTMPFGIINSTDMLGYQAFDEGLPLYAYAYNISSINDTGYISIKTASSTTDTNRRMECSEWWLE